MKTAAVLMVSFSLMYLILSIAGDGAAARAENTGALWGDTTKVRKERVRKETAPPLSPGIQTEVIDENEDEDDFWSSCIGGCLGDMFGSILASIFGGESENSDADAPADEGGFAIGTGTQIMMGEGGVRQGFPFLGTATPIDFQQATIELWDRPGGAAAGGAVTNTIIRGTEIKATECKYFENELWMLIESTGQDAFSGWLDDKEIIPYVTGTPSVQPAGEEEPRGDETAEPTRMYEASDTAQREAFRWYLRTEGSFPTFGQEAIYEEYRERSWGIGAEAGLFLTRSMKLDLLAGYTHGNGTPQYKYESGTSMDWPLTSDLDILSFGVQIGQLLTFEATPVYFGYGIGPSIFKVKESATIAEYESGSRTGTRTDELSEWKFGAAANVEAGWLAAGRIPIGFFVRWSYIPWNAHQEKSLTLDYLDKEGISYFNFGISVGYLFF